MLLLVGGGGVGESEQGQQGATEGTRPLPGFYNRGLVVVRGVRTAAGLQRDRTDKQKHTRRKSSSSLFCVSDDEAAHIKIGTKSIVEMIH